MISAHDVQQIVARRNKVKKDTYINIMNSFNRKIKCGVSVGMTKIMLEIPEFVLGYPLYDRLKATRYIKRQMEKLEYRVDQDGYCLYVSWGKSKLEEPKVQDEKIQEESLPSFINLRKMASKIIKSNKNGSNSRGS
jgi:hypothetical protein